MNHPLLITFFFQMISQKIPINPIKLDRSLDPALPTIREIFDTKDARATDRSIFCSLSYTGIVLLLGIHLVILKFLDTVLSSGLMFTKLNKHWKV